MKYYIVMTNNETGLRKYKRYKCISGFTDNKGLCWKFSKQARRNEDNRTIKERILHQLQQWEIKFYNGTS